MGQQQLLLLLLGIVIVGLSVVVGIQTFGDKQRQDEKEELVNDAIRLASDAQAYALKPEVFSGGGGDFINDYSREEVSLRALGYEAEDTLRVESRILWLSSTERDRVVIGGCSRDYDVSVTVTVTGTETQDILTQESWVPCP